MFYADIDTKYFFSTSNIVFYFYCFHFAYILVLTFFFFSLCFQVPLGCIRRLGAENLIPLDLEIEETLRKDKRVATQT